MEKKNELIQFRVMIDVGVILETCFGFVQISVARKEWSFISLLLQIYLEERIKKSRPCKILP